MDLQLEQISHQRPRSFSLMFHPRLSDLFFWHFHPEYELVYIEGASGTRHVGDHISEYVDSDLVLIGSNIPHLNFDYGIKTEYRKIVVHLQPAFFEQHLAEIPELAFGPVLQAWARHGVAFTGGTKNRIGQALLAFEPLSPIQQYLRLIEIFQQLAESEEYQLLHPQPYTRRYTARDQGRLRSIYGYIDQHYHEKIELAEMAALSNLTKEAFCRYFKKATGNTFVDFLNRYRISQAKRLLMRGQSVSDACFQSGFESLSYFNRTFKKITEENPRDFRKRYL
ncbi:MAG: AraC family transcriptional regulator [Bacteroidota bacterium]